MSDIKLSECLFVDLQTDEQRRDWFSLGRGVATGIIAPALQPHLVIAYSKIVESSKLIEQQAAEIDALKQELTLSTDQNDLLLDEFIRVKHLTDNTEIHGLCERAHVRMRQKVSVIERNHAMAAEIKALKAHIERFCEKIEGYHSEDIAAELAYRDDRIAELETQFPKWISVDEQLPKRDGEYIVFVTSCEDNTKFVDTDHFTTIDGFERWPETGCKVTYWMPLTLPQPPKE